MYSVRLTEEQAAWAKAHGGIAAVIERVMQSPTSTDNTLAGTTVRSQTAKPKITRSASSGQRSKPEPCRHPINRRIGKTCAVCGTEL